MEEKQPRRAKPRQRSKQEVDACREGRRPAVIADAGRPRRARGIRDGLVAVLVHIRDNEMRRAGRKRPHEVADERRVAAMFMNLRGEVDIRAGTLRIAGPISVSPCRAIHSLPDAPDSPVPLGDAERPRSERRPGVQAGHLTLESAELSCPLRAWIRHRGRF